MMKEVESYAQVEQDLFVLKQLNYKNNGLFLELGAWHPWEISNTFLLENKFGWDGISIDLRSDHQALWNTHRKCSFILHDALTFDYKTELNKLLQKHNKTEKKLDYLSLDLDPPSVTLDCLKILPLNEYRFNIITYEHDDYRDENRTIKNESRKYLTNLGYKLLVPDVKCSGAIFEDWYGDASCF